MSAIQNEMRKQMTQSFKKRRCGIKSLFIIASMIIQMLMVVPISQAGTLTEVVGFGGNPGNLKMYKYVPDNMPTEAPLVVSLHGCSQTASAYSSNGWTDLADEWKFYLLFPEQQRSNNIGLCFNWFERGDQRRGSGEAQSIVTMVEKMKSDHSIDDNRIFIEGLSAGGFMTAIMLAAYPDVFTGGGINAGGPAYSATDMTTAFKCMNPGCDKSPESWGDLVKTQGHHEHNGPWPKVSIWHGTNDPTVNIMNQRELLEQWRDVHEIDGVPDKEDTVRGYDHKEYHDPQGSVLVETYSITGMGHATPVDPGFSEANGCGTAGAFIEDKDICGVYYIARFWGLDQVESPCPGDNQPPTITLNGNARVKLKVGDPFADDGAVAIDPEDGDISSDIQVTGSVRTSEAGTYVLKYSVSDSTGCQARDVIRTVVVGMCQDWTGTNAAHKSAGRANSSWSWQWHWPFWVTKYYAVGSNDSLGRGSDETTLRKENPEQEHYQKGACPG